MARLSAAFKSIGDTLYKVMASRKRGNETPKTVNIVIVFFFMINFVLGTGFLGIPFAFFHAGALAGALTLLVVSFVSWVAAIWVLEVMARAQV